MEDALWAQLQNTSLEEYDDKGRIEPESESELESDQEDQGQTPVDFIPNEERQSGPHTGPKGVKADHDYHQQNQLVLKNRACADYNARMLAKAPTTTTYLQDAQEQELVIQQQQQQEQDDDELMYLREKRLNELKRLQQGNRSIRQQQKMFGTYKEIEANDYPNEIDQECKTTHVIIHVFDDKLPKCQELDRILQELAQTYTLAKFIRVSANDLEFDLVESPAILAYKGGELVANLVRLIDLVRSPFDTDAIKDILVKYGALSGNDRNDIPSTDSDEEDDE